MVKWESQTIRDFPRSPEDGHIYCILLIRIAFCHVSKILPLHCLFYITMKIYLCFYCNSAHDVVTVSLIFYEYLSLDLHIFTCTYRCTHTQAHMCEQHTRSMAATRRRSLVGRGRRKAFVRDKGFAHTNKKCQKIRYSPI